MSIVLVHGAWHGAWCWEPVVARLRSDGVDVHALDLPSDHADGTGFSEDVTAVRDLLDRLDDVVLCGHSYGGAVITEAGAHDHVRHLVYLCAFALDIGETTTDNAAKDDPHASAAPATVLGSGITVEGDHVIVDPDVARVAFYGDVADPPVERVVPHNLRAFMVGVAAAAWKDRPSTYVVCTEDRAIHPDVQRFFARRCGSTVELRASHSPMLSMPDRVAEILRSV